MVWVLRRFLADQCQHMAKMSRSREGKATWNGLAQRWAKIAEHLDASTQSVRLKRPRHNSPRTAVAD